EDLLGGTPEENAIITKEILQGAPGAKRTAVLLNAGTGLYLAGKAESMQAGIQLAGELIDSGKAYATLQKLIKISNLPEVAG
ncbi:MAG: anthranilate phosphoribosyltransferase, partial [Phascolarctobacterium sp.]|nr:anthranilate phosphoribosyltransferase [Phascolarctobacterium sp.]